MPKTLTEVTQDAAKLPPAERLKLARIMLDLSDVGVEPSVEVQGAWDEEIERRLRELRSGRFKGIPLHETRRRIEGDFNAENGN